MKSLVDELRVWKEKVKKLETQQEKEENSRKNQSEKNTAGAGRKQTLPDRHRPTQGQEGHRRPVDGKRQNQQGRT